MYVTRSVHVLVRPGVCCVAINVNVMQSIYKWPSVACNPYARKNFVKNGRKTNVKAQRFVLALYQILYKYNKGMMISLFFSLGCIWNYSSWKN